MTRIKDSNGNWVTVAGGQRMWVGTKAQLDAALAAGELEDNTLTAVLDDYTEGDSMRGTAVQIHPSINTGASVVNNKINSIPAGSNNDSVLIASFEKPTAFKGKACLFTHCGMRLDTTNVAAHHALQAVKSASTMPSWTTGALETVVGVPPTAPVPTLANSVTISVPADYDYVTMSRFGLVNNTGEAITMFETGVINWILL